MTTRDSAPLPSATPVAQTPSAQMAARLAADLDRRARYDPAALDAVEDEMRTLALRLAAPPEPLPEPDPVAPDPEGGQSLFHAIHLASYRVEENAVAGWQSLQVLFPDLLGTRTARVEEADLGSRGIFLRLKAGPYDTDAEARAACREVEAAGGWCAVTDFTGRALGR
ncbi:SPOR domain-containing protein [Hyphobacterium sp.]|uniref:SPOR domain-containing protein n=1 Tax=Hyphobacterium sp. TaxID=2004662 RepID=UPI003747CCE2